MTSSTPPSGSPRVSPSVPSGNGGTNGTTVNARTRTAIAMVITLVWAASFVADIVVPDYSPSPLIHMAMIGLGAAVFGSNFVKGITR